MTSPLFNPMKRNPTKPQLQDSLKPLLENKLKTNILQTRLNLNCTWIITDIHLKTVDWSYNNFTLHLLDDVLLSLWTRNIQLCNIHTLTYTLNSDVRLRDDFNFPIVNFPFICSNISVPCEYGVCYSRLLGPIRISLLEDCCWKKSRTKSSCWLDLKITSKITPLVLSGDHQSLVFCVVFCSPLFVLIVFVLFPLAIVLFVLSLMASDYLFVIFKLFLA
jgi:hypothetical protein